MINSHLLMNRGILFKLTLIICSILCTFSCKDDEQVSIEEEKPKASTEPVELKLDTLLEGLSNPWSIAFVDKDKLLFTEKSGSLYLLENGKATAVTGLPAIVAIGQGGLLDVVVHPKYAENQWIFFSCVTGSNASMSTALFKAKLNGTALSEVTKLFQADPMNGSTAHFGSRIVLDGEFVYLSLGERNFKQTSQETTNHNGSIIRLRQDGTVPEDNPFYNTNAQKTEIWSFGHRNVQGLAKNPMSGDLWAHEHGPKGGDEINIIEKGANYGWPLATFGIDYNGTVISKDTFVPGTVLPIYYWVPSIAPCGMNFYNSDSIPQWKGNLFLGALAGKHLNRLVLDGDKVIEEERLLQNKARFRAVIQGPDGYLYFATEQPGMIMRYRPKG